MAAVSSESNIKTLLMAFRYLGLPLLRASVERKSKQGTPPEEQEVVDNEAMANLVQGTVMLAKKLSEASGANEGEIDAWVRWSLASDASKIVGAVFKSSDKVLTEAEADDIVKLTLDLRDKFSALAPAESEINPNTVATFKSKLLEAFVPVVGAVSQYSFGRAEHALLAEVAERLTKTADRITRAIAPSGATPEQWRLLCWNVLKVAGQCYMDAHFAEADRLLYMDPDDRAEYFAKHGQIVPMTQVWQSFNQRMAMLSTLASYLEVPDAARLDADSW
ncbi:MAG: hypothetical protein FWF23_05775 [Alphaproteobacteria bacterium]|nr:hypothetical protein [Alphaproteobacteria bacterium]MCL2505474.1 hypothetical protein [Alphaproteobacteria bacterium]